MWLKYAMRNLWKMKMNYKNEKMIEKTNDDEKSNDDEKWMKRE